MAERPIPPAAVPPGVADRLADLDPEQLRAVADHANQLAEFQERRDRSEEDDEESGTDEDHEYELPDDVPSKATIVVKTINDNDYYYWQWRDGDSVKSKYERPVDPDG